MVDRRQQNREPHHISLVHLLSHILAHLLQKLAVDWQRRISESLRGEVLRDLGAVVGNVCASGVGRAGRSGSALSVLGHLLLAIGGEMHVGKVPSEVLHVSVSRVGRRV